MFTRLIVVGVALCGSPAVLSWTPGADPVPAEEGKPVQPAKSPEVLQEENARLRKLLEGRKPVPVHSYEVTGTVLDDVAELKVKLTFRTETDGAVISIGCRQAHLTALELDGKQPLVWQGTEGLLLEVEKKGDDHTATAEMLVPLRDMPSGGRGGVTPPLPPRPAPGDALQGFELDLPLAAVTHIDLKLPKGARELEVNGKPLPPPLELKGDKLTGWMGKTGPLKVAWKRPLPDAGEREPPRAAKGAITVRVHPDRVNTEAELALESLGRPVPRWRLYLPAKARVRLADPADQTRLQASLERDRGRGGRWTLTLGKPAREPVKLLVSVSQERGKGAILLGPFAVEGALSQSGTVRVRAGPDERVRLRPARAGGAAAPPDFETAQRKLDRDKPGAEAVTAFQYWGLSAAEGDDLNKPWFNLEVDSIRGMLNTSLRHTLRLLPGQGEQETRRQGDKETENEARPARPLSPSAGWRLETIIDATPVRAGVEEVEVEWPAPWRFDRQRWPADVATDITEDPARRLTRFTLLNESLKPFAMKLEAVPEEGKNAAFPTAPNYSFASAVLKLPRPRQMARDNGGHRITVVVPDGLDLRVPQPENPLLKLESQEAHQIVWRAERFPEEVAVGWRPYRPEVRVDSTVDVSLTADRIRVTHRLRYTFLEKGTPPSAVLLRVPKELTAPDAFPPAVLAGAKRPLRDDYPHQPKGEDKILRCLFDLTPQPPAGPSPAAAVAEVTLEYSVPRRAGNGEGAGLLAVPLVAPVEATRGQALVRVWGEPGGTVRAVPGPWETRPPEVVPDRPGLPALALRGGRPALPLQLRYTPPEGAGGTLSPVAVERALIEVRVAENGFQHYRARLRLRRPGAPFVDVALPAPVTALGAQFFLGGEELTKSGSAGPQRGYWEPVGDSGAGAPRAAARVARVFLPASDTAGSLVLDVSYQLAPGQAGDGNALWTTLRPITLPGAVAGVPTRWQVDLPPGWVPLSLEGGPASSWRWGWRGWLLRPSPAVTHADLERWFLGEELSGTPSPEEPPLSPSFAGWRGRLAPLTLYHAPRQGWLLACSLGLVLIGLLLYFAPSGASEGPPGRLFWPAAALLGLTAAALALVWPGLLGAVAYGCQPGLVVLVLVIGVHWLAHERYRRRVVFLPGFRRMKAGSSLERAGADRPGSAAPAGQEENGKASHGSQGSRAQPPRPAPIRTEPSTVDAPEEKDEG